LGLTSKKERYSSQDCKITEGQLKVFYTYRVLKSILLNKDSGAWVFLGLIELLLKVSTEPGSSSFSPVVMLGLLMWYLGLSPAGFKIAATVLGST